MGSVDFVYLPMDLQKKVAFGFAFVNLTSNEIAAEAKEQLSHCGIAVEWSEHQGLAAHIERYRNSLIMHESVADDAKPLLLCSDAVLPFPEPSVDVRAPCLETSKTKPFRKRASYKARKAAAAARAMEGRHA